MEASSQSAAEEKMRLQERLQLQEGHESSMSSQSRGPASGRNTVPMTEEELESSPVYDQQSPLYSLVPDQQSPPPSQSAIPRRPVPGSVPGPVPRPVPESGLEPVPRSPTPPPYSGPSTPAQEPIQPHESQTGGPRPPPRYPGLPALDYRLYKPPLFELSSDKTTIKTTAAHLSTSAEALVALIRQQATVPPKPQVHIVGRRGSSPNSGRVDFDIKLNLLPLLVPEDPRQRMDYLRCVGPGEVAFRGGSKPSTQPEVDGDGSLDAWAARFVADTASVKAFALERVVVNLDMDWLEGQIRKLVVGMRYPGTVAVSFPVTHNRVVVQNPDRVNKFITSVTGLFVGKRKYEVVKAVWPFATMPKGSEGEGRRCAVQSEEVWWREWKDPIRYAIATKRHGWVTNEDKLEALMEGTPSTTPADVDWGPEY
ncbi:hypothetical protein MYCTH_2299147 [Thermothelomyces thermophilus ATCC 42464]|uniref:Uncharacterized protein n=1 Tax=Thermothelomyces thermophilus (strain ATCC 42464 / BCRC 31852 / DSM 1799) TaxID=573729 RepID=G2Q4U3_THET4|nr:uncharacterized protein MYCTH_2299147 [Thermothelomyces thermophilus ATCC 42464]AEO55382.1 hypothetical protein MYCTH_2299147 [Thermothelomyces thermophilus ATCC 42464]